MTSAALFFFSISIAIAFLIGYLVADRLCPADYPRWLVWALAPPTGLGICSLIVFFFRRPMFTIEGALLTVLAFRWLRSHGASLKGWYPKSPPRVPLLGVIFAVALFWSIGSSVGHVVRYPHGLTDAWAIWNSHARYMASGVPTWREDLQYTFHPDYPLLLPGVIVHSWRYIGNTVADVPGFIGIVFEVAGIVVLACTLVRLRKPTVALLMGFVLIESPFYVNNAVWEYADVPLSVFILCTVALICLYEEETSKPLGLMALAGFMAGCAAWTKNEGLAFALIAFTVLLAPVFWRPSATQRRIAGFAAGLALPLAAVVYFKMTAPANDILSLRNSEELVAKILNVDRHNMILEHFRATFWNFGEWTFNPLIPILAFIAFSGLDRTTLRSFSWRAGVVIVAMMLVAYYAIYVITPMDLNWHLESSMDRLLLHLWPLCLLLAGMTARSAASEKTLGIQDAPN